MKTKENLIKKVKRLVNKAGIPKHLNHFGPKIYEFWEHALAFLVKQECKLGYRRVSRLLRGLGRNCPCPSALCMSFHKIPLALWQRILAATAGMKVNIVAMDGSGMSRTLPSPYYYKRIDKPYPIEIPLKISFAIDTRTKKILSLRLRAKRTHDIRDVKYLLTRVPVKPRKLVADKAYDAEWVHEFCKSRGITAVIPMRNFGSRLIPRNRKLRLECKKTFNRKTYARRQMIESVFSSIKRKFGASVSSVMFSAQRAEMYCRAITHNIISVFETILNGAARNYWL